MTQEEKAQAYDEALKKAEAFYYSATTEPITEREVLANIFPELKESEDERVRKAIIESLPKYGYLPQTSIKVEDAITWLENQKERSTWSKDEEYTLARIIEYLEDNDCPSEWKDLLHDVYALPYQKEQKPWSEEDKRKINRIYSILGQAADTHAFSTTCRLISDKECVELQDFLKALNERYTWKPSDEQMENLSRAFNGATYQVSLLRDLYLDLKKLREG